MSRENEKSQEPWEEPPEGDSNEDETRLRRRPRSSRDAYDDLSARPKQRQRRADAPRETSRDRPDYDEERPRPRPTPPRANDPRQRYDAYGRPRQGTHPPGYSYDPTTEAPRERSRQTHDFHEQPNSYDEVDERYQQRRRMSRQSREEAYARLRQRSRQPIYSRDEAFDAYPYPQQRRYPPTGPEVEEYNRPAPRARARTQPTQQPERRGRSFWSTLLIGCIGGIITIALVLGVIAFVLFRTMPFKIGNIGKTSYTKQLQQSLPITAGVKQLQILNRVGNITIIVDTAATQGTLTAVKKVQASSSSNADQEFGRIPVDVKTGGDPSILTVNATVPDSSGGLLASSTDSVDLTLVLPSSVANSNPTSPFTLSAGISAAGDISVQNFNGLLTLTDNTGNISVTHGLLLEGSCLQTNNGHATFDGLLGISTDSGLIPCTTNTTQSSHPWFSIKSGTGNIDVTLSAAKTNVILDANTNNGKINSGEFGLNIQQNSDGSASYYGLLVPGSSPTALLALTVSTGNINLHKALTRNPSLES
jgi:hypothetical protein